MKKEKYYNSLRSYYKILLTHCIILSEGSITCTNDLGVTYNIDERDLIDEFKSCFISVGKPSWPYCFLYSSEHIVNRKYKYE